MTKYWNPRRIRRVREREQRALATAAAKALAEQERRRSYTSGDIQKNARLMLDSLGIKKRRDIALFIKRGGAMSVSKFADHFNLTLPSAMAHVHALERAGIITTHKRGRIRFCVHNPGAFKELARWLLS